MAESYPDRSVAGTMLVSKTSGAAAVTTSAGTGLSDQHVAKVEFSVTWMDPGGRQRTRSSTSLISNSGISKPNLIASVSGANPVPPSATPPPATPGAATPPPSTPLGPMPVPSTPVPATPTGSGNVNGKGNVGGNPGKK